MKTSSRAGKKETRLCFQNFFHDKLVAVHFKIVPTAVNALLHYLLPCSESLPFQSLRLPWIQIERGPEFLNQVFTGDGSWIFQTIPKYSSSGWLLAPTDRRSLESQNLMSNKCIKLINTSALTSLVYLSNFCTISFRRKFSVISDN